MGLDERHAQPERRQCGRQSGADHAAADDRDIEWLRGVEWLGGIEPYLAAASHQAASIKASIASGDFSSAAVITSAAPLVTSTSSSMRTPMFQNSFGMRGDGRT